MNPRRQNIALIFLVCLGIHFRVVTSEIDGKSAIQFSDEFVDFLQNMGSRVYKYKQKYNESVTKIDRRSYDAENIPRRKVNKNQKGLNDILMMKLVSFYEDKYNLNRFKVTNEPRIPIAATTEHHVSSSRPDTKTVINKKHFTAIWRNMIVNPIPSRRKTEKSVNPV